MQLQKQLSYNIALSADDDKRMQLVDSMETYANGTNEEIIKITIINQYQKLLTMTMTKKT